MRLNVLTQALVFQCDACLVMELLDTKIQYCIAMRVSGCGSFIPIGVTVCNRNRNPICCMHVTLPIAWILFRYLHSAGTLSDVSSNKTAIEIICVPIAGILAGKQQSITISCAQHLFHQEYILMARLRFISFWMNEKLRTKCTDTESFLIYYIVGLVITKIKRL